VPQQREAHAPGRAITRVDAGRALVDAQIVQCHSTTGESDYSLTVLVADIQAYEQFLQGVLLKLPGITQVRTRIALKEIKGDA
jgi:DNA-binding Lrp family transcriptional regulator